MSRMYTLIPSRTPFCLEEMRCHANVPSRPSDVVIGLVVYYGEANAVCRVKCRLQWNNCGEQSEVASGTGH